MPTPAPSKHEHSPFDVPAPDLTQLDSNPAFHVVREFLAAQNSFCDEHLNLPTTARQTYTFHRDVLHALILPLLQIHTQCTRLASSLLQTPNPAHLELAFRGNARGAFSWLQCFISEERAWCATTGCPACVVLHTLSMEPTIRVSVVACRLSETLQKLFEDVCARDGAQRDTAPRLPGFGFWEACLKDAVDRDEFWGEGYWEEIEGRAADLELGLKELMNECLHPRKERFQKGDCATLSSRRAVSGFAKRQLTLVKEEQEWMQKLVVACWSTLLSDVALESRTVSSTRRPLPPPRTRSLTT